MTVISPHGCCMFFFTQYTLTALGSVPGTDLHTLHVLPSLILALTFRQTVA